MMEGVLAIHETQIEGLPGPAVLPDQEDQITHEISLDDEVAHETGLDIFKVDPDFVESEKYKAVTTEAGGGDSAGEVEGGDNASTKASEGALLGFECNLREKLGRLFEPYVIHILPILLIYFSDPVAVRDATHAAARAMMSQLSGPGVKLVLPVLMKVGSDVMRNPEIAALVPTSLISIADPNEHTKPSPDLLLQILCKQIPVDPIPEVRPIGSRALGALMKGIDDENVTDLVPGTKSETGSVERSGAAQGLSEVAGTSGMVVIDGGSDDEGASTEAHDRGIVNILGAKRRNEVLGAVHMVRSGVSLAVRQLATIHVRKTLVANTPETLKEVTLASMRTLIDSLASTSSKRRQVAGRSLGELVQKLGGRALPSMIPILAKGREAPIPSTRQYENGSSASTHPSKSCADPCDMGLCDPWSGNEQASEVPSLLTCWAWMRFPGKRWPPSGPVRRTRPHPDASLPGSFSKSSQHICDCGSRRSV